MSIQLQGRVADLEKRVEEQQKTIDSLVKVIAAAPKPGTLHVKPKKSGEI